METQTLKLNFYGVEVIVSGPQGIVNNLVKDFSYFIADKNDDSDSIEINIAQKKPDFGRVPAVKASLYQPDSVSYDNGSVRYVDYFGKALSIYDYDKEKGELYSDDINLLHELSYLLILSRAGEMLDKNGIHRVHACGFAIDGKGVLCLMPQGGGKTTLYLELLKNEDVRLISDDTPLITRDSTILPFPLRIGVTEGATPDVPQEFLGSIDRRKHGKKILIDTKYFAGRISAPVKAGFILAGEREFSDNPRIVKAAKLKILSALFRDCVIGLGLPQMVEYFLRFQTKDVLSKIGIVSSRNIACVKAVLKARTYRFIIGTNPSRNAEELIRFLKDCK